MGFMGAILGSVASAVGSTMQSASSSVANEAMKASSTAIESAVENGLQDGISGFASRAEEAAAADLADDSMDIQKAVADSGNETKNFFSRAWDESKQAAGIDGNGANMGKIGYNAAKMAIAKGDSSEPQKMEPAQAQASAPSIPVANAEDELNRLRNRMNVS